MVSQSHDRVGVVGCRSRRRHAQLLGVVPPLLLRPDRVGARTFGLKRRHGPALPVAEHAVGLPVVWQRVFEQELDPSVRFQPASWSSASILIRAKASVVLLILLSRG